MLAATPREVREQKFRKFIQQEDAKWERVSTLEKRFDALSVFSKKMASLLWDLRLVQHYKHALYPLATGTAFYICCLPLKAISNFEAVHALGVAMQEENIESLHLNLSLKDSGETVVLFCPKGFSDQLPDFGFGVASDV